MKKKVELTIRDIASLVKWKEVKRALEYHYPSYSNRYGVLFERIRKMSKVKTKKGESLVIEGGLDIESEWFEKEGAKFLEEIKSGDEKLYYSLSLNVEGEELRYGVSFIKWNYMVSLPINSDTLNHYTFEDILAHFLWEITFYGNEKQMEKFAEELHESVREIKKEVAKTKPL